ncbi:chromosomal replication initiator DnaA [Rhodobacteraceae bacterium W635]|uniref:chromosomal replication initiator DnaA n=1 Tax=Nioella halotolerans TaxID=2303578 RepID=UPI000E3C6AF8|nr:chromosomal replication initiator DnaA [Rhodobacteraceae bacterium W635]
MAEQLILNLPVRPALGRDDFFVSDGNAAAVAGIEAWQGWPHGKMVLVGPEASGKTHLAHVWAGMTGATVIAAGDLPGPDPDGMGAMVAVEDADRVTGTAAETALFHLHNAVTGQGGRLLLTARNDPARWPVALPDLKSRVQQAGVLKLAPPDDALLSAVMVKMAADRQLVLAPGLVSYAVLRMERSFAAARALIEAIDARALRDKSRPTKTMIAALLARQAE